MTHSYFPTIARFGRRKGWLALLWLLCCGTAAVAQPTTYCTSNLGAYCGTGNANISGVAIASTTLNNPNTICNTVNGSGYTLFPTAGTTTGTLLRGLAYQVSVTTLEAGIISVWFDWNQDGTFDASEWTQVTTLSTAGAPATAAVTVPVTATLGLTGMRVRSRLNGNINGATDACSNFGSGETEDYTVTIGAAPSCAPPAGLTATNISTTGATLGFATATNGTATNYIVQYGASGFTPGGTGSTTVNTTSTSTAITGLTANTVYQFYVTKDCGGGQTSQVAGPFTFRTACVAATYATLPVSESFESTWVGICDTQDSPSAFWRNTPTTGNNSWRRDDDGTSANWTSPTVGGYSPTGSQGTRSARFHSYYAGAGALGTLDLYVNLGASGNKVLQFDYLNTAGNDSLQVQVSTDGGNTFGAPLIRLGVSGTVAQGWQPQSVSLTATSATTVVRFRTKVTTTFTSDIGLDNVRINLLSGVPSCATNILPAAGAVNQARNTSLSWQAGTGVVTGYDVYFGTTATPPLVSTNQPGTTYTAPALLAAATTYYYQIVPRNANGAATSCGVQSFTTNSVPVYCNPSNTALGGFCGGNDITQVTLGGSGLNATGLTCNTVITSVGTSYYTSYPVSGTTTGTVLQGLSYSLAVTVSGSSILSVWGDWNQNGTFEASEWTQIATASPTGTPVTVSITIPATATLGLTGLRIRSRGTGNPNGATDACSNFGGGETKDFVVTVGPAPACAPPTALLATNVTTTTATLSFSGATNGTATGYVVQYGPNGFTPGGTGSTSVNTTTTSVPVTGLTANTTYQFYVTKNCGAGQTSQTAGPFTFTTLCLAPVYATLPVTQSFESTWVNGCDTRDIPTTSWRNLPTTGNNSWRRDDDGASANWTSPTLGTYTPAASQGTRSARFHTYYAPSGSIGTLDLFVNLSTAGAKRLSFDYVNTSGTDSLVIQLSTDGGATFSRLAGYSQSGTIATGFVTQVLPISATSATSVIRFRARGDYGVTDIGLDNVVLESATGCLTPASLTATTTTTTASLSWLTGGTGTYTVVYGPTGFNPALPSGTGNVYTTVTGLTAPPYAITGLTPGTTYQFYVTSNCGAGTNSGTAGPQSFTTQIVNDDPCGATLLTVNNTCTPLSTTTFGATTTATSVYATGGQGAGCGSITAPRDVWFRFTTAATGPTSTAVRISVTGGAASVVRAYSGTACTGPLTYLNCAGTAANTAAPNLDLTALTPSTTYYIRVNEYSTAGTLGNFTICAVPVPNCPTPAGLGTGTVGSSTAVLTWSANASSGSTFTVQYGLSGFTPGGAGSTTVSGITAQTATLTNLQPNSNYCFVVQQVCGGFNGASAVSAQSCFTTLQSAPTNDEPCTAATLGTTVLTGSNVGATTSVQNGISLPACSSASAPKDVWFAFTPTGTTTTLTMTGAPAGMVRVYSSPSCSAGPFSLVTCASSGSNNTAITAPVNVTGLTAGTRYYVAVSGYGSSDTGGTFTIAGSGLVTSARAQADTDALLVYPNPSNTGQLTLKLSGLSGGNGQAALLNALGQVVRTKALTAAPEQTLDTRNLATGVYTLRVTAGSQVLTRKVVLE